MHSVSTAVSLDLPLSGSYAAKTFNSLRGAWVEGQQIDGRSLRRGIPLEIDGKGFCVIELRQEI